MPDRERSSAWKTLDDEQTGPNLVLPKSPIGKTKTLGRNDREAAAACLWLMALSAPTIWTRRATERARRSSFVTLAADKIGR
jgi:hypothetical protein